MSAALIVKPLVAMLKPSASFSDHGWRAIAMCGTRWIVAARYENAVTVENGVVVKTGDAEAHAKLFAAAPELVAALEGVLRVADRATEEFNAARAAIAKATGAAV